MSRVHIDAQRDNESGTYGKMLETDRRCVEGHDESGSGVKTQ